MCTDKRGFALARTARAREMSAFKLHELSWLGCCAPHESQYTGSSLRMVAFTASVSIKPGP